MSDDGAIRRREYLRIQTRDAFDDKWQKVAFDSLDAFDRSDLDCVWEHGSAGAQPRANGLFENHETSSPPLTEGGPPVQTEPALVVVEADDDTRRVEDSIGRLRRQAIPTNFFREVPSDATTSASRDAEGNKGQASFSANAFHPSRISRVIRVEDLRWEETQALFVSFYDSLNSQIAKDDWSDYLVLAAYEVNQELFHLDLEMDRCIFSTRAATVRAERVEDAIRGCARRVHQNRSAPSMLSSILAAARGRLSKSTAFRNREVGRFSHALTNTLLGLPDDPELVSFAESILCESQSILREIDSCILERGNAGSDAKLLSKFVSLRDTLRRFGPIAITDFNLPRCSPIAQQVDSTGGSSAPAILRLAALESDLGSAMAEIYEEMHIRQMIHQLDTGLRPSPHVRSGGHGVSSLLSGQDLT